jgi:isoleucyl-tRNA synthetase
VLEVLSRLLAPFTPFHADWLHRALLGKRFGSRTPLAAQAIRALGSDALVAARQTGAPLRIHLEGEELALVPEEFDVREEARGDLAVESEAGYTAALDPALDEELVLEGIARELVSRLQRLRRDAGFHVSDRIHVQVHASGPVRVAAERHGSAIAAETLATRYEVLVEGSPLPPGAQRVELDGAELHLVLERSGEGA